MITPMGISMPPDTVNLNGKTRVNIPRFYEDIPKTIVSKSASELVNAWSQDNPAPGFDKEENITTQLQDAAVVHPPMKKK